MAERNPLVGADPLPTRCSTPVLHRSMSTTTVRLDDEDEAILDLLAAEYGGRSSVIRQALRSLAAERRRSAALSAFLSEWDSEAGAVADDEVAAMTVRYGL